MSEEQPLPPQEQPSPAPQMPPVGSVPPGYPPPGYAPYGYMPPMQPYYVPPGYVPANTLPASDYYVPSELVLFGTQQRLVQQVPANKGNLWQAWVSIATNLSRANIAGWAQAATKGWVSWSIAIFCLIDGALGALVSIAAYISILYFLPQIHDRLSSQADIDVYNAVLSFTQSYGLLVVIGFVAFIMIYAPLGVFYNSFWWALFMPGELGKLAERYRRNLKPYALSLMGPLCASLLIVLLLMGFGALALVNPAISFAGLIIVDLLSLLLSVYSIAMVVQAGSVGTTMNRWAVFGVNFLAGVVAQTVISFLLFIPAIFIMRAIMG
jgi:hypothetical protein